MKSDAEAEQSAGVCCALRGCRFGIEQSGTGGRSPLNRFSEKSVSNPTDDKYPEVAKAITQFMNKDAKGALGQLTIAKQKNPKLPPAE